jgi:hypothetical protein
MFFVQLRIAIFSVLLIPTGLAAASAAGHNSRKKSRRK